jgi:hypothetical protein
MAKLTLTPVTSGYGTSTVINANYDAIEAALELTLTRTGTSPNSMQDVLDMNNNRIINLPDAVSIGEPITLGQAQELTGVQTIITEEYRFAQDIGYLRLPCVDLEGEDITLELEGLSTYYFQSTAEASNVTIPLIASEDLGVGYIVSLGVAVAGGSIQILVEGGITLIDLATGDVGEFIMDGPGAATVWHVGSNVWHIHGTNVVEV